jgi:hypothetical protein
MDSALGGPLPALPTAGTLDADLIAATLGVRLGIARQPYTAAGSLLLYVNPAPPAGTLDSSKRSKAQLGLRRGLRLARANTIAIFPALS